MVDQSDQADQTDPSAVQSVADMPSWLTSAQLRLIPVAHDPFADDQGTSDQGDQTQITPCWLCTAQTRLIPVTHDPFADKPSLLAQAVSPVTNTPSTYARMNREAREQMGQGLNELFGAQPGGPIAQETEEARSRAFKGLYDLGAGALGYTFSPINAAIHSIVSQPLENTIGVPSAWTNFGASFFIPVPGFGMLKVNKVSEFPHVFPNYRAPNPETTLSEVRPKIRDGVADAPDASAGDTSARANTGTSPPSPLATSAGLPQEPIKTEDLGASGGPVAGPREKRLIGSFEPPADIKPRTTTFGIYAHRKAADILQGMHPEVPFILSVEPRMKGVDVTVPAKNIDEVGFEHGEIKPLTESGRRTMIRQIHDWELDPNKVRPITYDANGNVYYFGF
jgi:hypothetical protein